MKRSVFVPGVLGFLVCGLFAPFAAADTQAAADQAAADAVCAAVRVESAFDYEGRFTENFRLLVPAAELQQIFASLARSFGPCASATPTGLTTAENALIDIQLHTAPDGRIDGLFVTSVHDLRLAPTTWEGFAAALDRLPGRSSAFLSPAGLGVRANRPNPIGSVFKLWVLGTLYGRVHAAESAATPDANWQWESPRAIREDWKSFPSGDLHNAPAGTQLSLRELARKMIADSDNTATDHLIRDLGRDEVAATAVAMGRTRSSRLPAAQPLLLTQEFFKLKWARTDNQADAYVAAGPAERRAILDRLATVPRSDVCLDPSCFGVPTHIQSIEYLATARETCAAMDWLTAKNDTAIDATLSANVPFVQVRDPAQPSQALHWTWAGFKGGSEPGVLHFTFGLRSASGRSGCFALAWNDADAPAGDAANTGTRLALQALVRAGLALAEGAID